MGKNYTQLGLSERVAIGAMLETKASFREIALRLGRSPATVCREVARNSVKTKVWAGGYDPVRAEALAERRRRWDARFKLERRPELRAAVLDRLAMGWSPEQIAGRLALENDGVPVVSCESVYRWIYHRSAQKDFLHRLLPRRKSRRGWYRRRSRAPQAFLPCRVPIGDRGPAGPGDWEADVLMFSDKKTNVLVLLERASRRLALWFQPDRSSRRVADNLASALETVPTELRKSVAFDNGPEFCLHTRLHALGAATYFCDLRRPWQKGAVENANGRLRRSLPRNKNLAGLDQQAVLEIQRRHNSAPRKCLGYKTPDEVFSEMTVALQT